MFLTNSIRLAPTPQLTLILTRNARLPKWQPLLAQKRCKLKIRRHAKIDTNTRRSCAQKEQKQWRFCEENRKTEITAPTNIFKHRSCVDRLPLGRLCAFLYGLPGRCRVEATPEIYPPPNFPILLLLGLGLRRNNGLSHAMGRMSGRLS